MRYNQRFVTAIILCIFFVVLVQQSSSAFVCEDYNDCLALLKFREGITSDPYGNLQGWNEANPFCNWTGVTCHKHVENRVVALELIDMKLQGSLSPFLSNLSLLTRLQLHINMFFGEIPRSLGALSELAHLNLSLNKLQNNIPASLQGCQSLKLMDLSNNNLSGIQNSTALLEISLIEDGLSGEIPPESGSKLQNLQKLYLSINQFSGKIPVTLSNLSQLILLDLSLNKLEGELLLELGRLKNLENLYLHSNDLVSGFDNSSLSFLIALTNCSHLKKLHLGSCLFAGKLPDSIGDLSKELYYFNLRSNRITGYIPENIGNLSGLVNLNLSSNFLDGKIPAGLGKLGQLQRLNMARNRILGTIPGEVVHMAKLGLLDLGDNLISGSIPPSLGNLSWLRYLYLSHTSLSGEFAIELTECSLLMLLDLSYNRLSGSIPPKIGLFSDLPLSLNLSNNNFEGHIPETIGKLMSVQAIDFSKKNFSGVVPSSIGGCIALEYLNFCNNMLQGPIPESLKQITYLGVLDLAHNQLNGTIPAWIGVEQAVKTLNLSITDYLEKFPKMGVLIILVEAHFWRIWGCVVAQHKWVFLHVKFSTKNTREGRGTYTQRELESATAGFNKANLLGQGSSGSIYKAVVNQGKTTIAVKVFHEESGQSYESLQRECEILSQIKHRNLLRIIGSAWNSQFKALVLKFMPNGNLEQHLYPGGLEEDPCKLTLEERLSVAIDVASGLEYLQEGCPTQVVHCDLKPQNVLLDNDTVAHIADFGIGKLLLDKPNGEVS
ncbi:Mitogen-activated protein kinase kinase kinase [Parasponia andersonii]|uniref:non-specific serine/threonine protein kinase n=1 Tax=Parasponia andersonii TaxID=3476 RepID=A0A2P5DSY5_PARAD|nr:Mitogen-activated protein kinase kinase kinase [Parasponia andersonii]